MSRSCQDFREDLRLCIVASECMKGGRSFHDCLKTPENLDDKCRTVLGAYKQCRMNWIDNRTRIKGNMPGMTEKEEREAQAKFEKRI